MDDNFVINIKIAERSYPIPIKRSDEEYIREAVKWVNKMLINYQSAYKDEFEVRDYLALIAVKAASYAIQYEREHDMTPFDDKVRELAERLDAYLKEGEE